MARIELPDGVGFRTIVRALDGPEGATRLVGGCVRDALVGAEAKDIDLATTLAPEEVIARLKAAGIKAVPTGISHGTVTAIGSDGAVEVTTLRHDVATDGRRATVAFTEDWRADAERRDFTINALYADPVSGEISDYFGGIDDLNSGVVRFIGEPLVRIAEDHLRILRFFRFHARFGQLEPHQASLEACITRANDLMALSRERIAMELLAILSLPDPSPTLALMIESGILAPVLPEITSAAALADLVQSEAVSGIESDPLRRLSSLIPADCAVADDIASRLKLSNAQKKRLVAAADRKSAEMADARALAYWVSPAFAVDQLLLQGRNVAPLKDWSPPRFPLSGGDIVKRGISAGPDVARLLKYIERQWVAEGFPDAARATAIADTVVSDSLKS